MAYCFPTHAIIATDRSIPSPIFVAALIGVENILRIDFDLVPAGGNLRPPGPGTNSENTPAFGRPIGVTMNYALNRAIRYDLEGKPLEVLTEAVRCGKAFLSIPPSKKDLSADLGKALGLR